MFHTTTIKKIISQCALFCFIAVLFSVASASSFIYEFTSIVSAGEALEYEQPYDPEYEQETMPNQNEEYFEPQREPAEEAADPNQEPAYHEDETAR